MSTRKAGIVSRDGHCRPFDAAASGTVFGHGVGLVVLKRLEDAVRDGDHITAVLRGFAVNNDGSAKAGYMAPGVEGQARVIGAARPWPVSTQARSATLKRTAPAPRLAIPVELAALTRAFRAGGAEASQFCVVGTAKANVGHLDAAAGVTGVIKTALQLERKTIPGLAHFVSPNLNLELEGSPVSLSGRNGSMGVGRSASSRRRECLWRRRCQRACGPGKRLRRLSLQVRAGRAMCSASLANPRPPRNAPP